MNRTLLFDSPFLLGFEHTRSLIEQAAKAAADTWPPYNVEAVDGERVRITLAVAGFSPDQLSVSVEDRRLVIKGDREGEDRAYIHRGIAARGFVRAFILADGLEVEGASIEHGLLRVELVRPEPARAIRQIPIKTTG